MAATPFPVIPTNVGIHCAELSRISRPTVAFVDPDVRRDDPGSDQKWKPLTTLNLLNLIRTRS